jgi:hypothetical protein
MLKIDPAEPCRECVETGKRMRPFSHPRPLVTVRQAQVRAGGELAIAVYQ